MAMNLYDAEMNKLIKMLFKANIPFEIMTDLASNNTDGPCTSMRVYCPCVPKKSMFDFWVIDAICNSWSLGGNKGLIEIYTGLLPEIYEDEDADTVAGYLSAEEALEFFKMAWKKALEKWPDRLNEFV